MQAPRRRFVRARQRDRADAFPGFDRTFAPRLFEWCIDRFTFTLHGSWRTDEGSGQTLFENRFDDPIAPWLCVPVGTGYKRSVVTRKVSSFTVGRIAIVATGCTRQEGRIAVEATVNPTRTLSALLLQYGDREDFVHAISELDALTFFRRPPSTNRLPLSLDGNDNYLPSRPSARHALPPDPFEQFMPIYLSKMRSMIGRAIAAVAGEVENDGTEQVFSPAHAEIRINWGAVEVPQIESYFERYHSRAVAAVRTAGVAVIDGDPRPLLRLYPHEPDFERHADCYRVSLTATDRHRLIIYAKTAERIRFEVKRHGRGRYDGIGAGTAPDHRLLGILFQVERPEANRLLDWLEIFRQFDEPDAPALGDLVELIASILRAANGDEREARTLVERLFVDGGLSPDLYPEIDAAAIRALSRAGVIAPTSLRSRHRAGQRRRYALTSDYAWLRQAILTALAEVRAPASLE